MSNQGYYDQNQSHNPYQQNPPPAHNFQSNNPWADESGNPAAQHQQHQNQQQQYGGYQAPPGPPPSHQQHQQQQQQHGPPSGHEAPKRAGTFRESDFVPEAERGEQREAMQQFEMNASGQAKNQQDHDLETLQREFPGMDGSLVAALYADAGSMAATKEMLMELDGK